MRILFNDQLFDSPADIISCHKLSEVRSAFEKMEEAIARGYYLAGFLSYEAGYAFEELFHHNKTYDFPLVCFGAFKKPTSSADFQPAPFLHRKGKRKKKKGPPPPPSKGEGGRFAPSACLPAGRGEDKKGLPH